MKKRKLLNLVAVIAMVMSLLMPMSASAATDGETVYKPNGLEWKNEGAIIAPNDVNYTFWVKNLAEGGDGISTAYNYLTFKVGSKYICQTIQNGSYETDEEGYRRVDGEIHIGLEDFSGEVELVGFCSVLENPMNAVKYTGTSYVIDDEEAQEKCKELWQKELQKYSIHYEFEFRTLESLSKLQFKSYLDDYEVVPFTTTEEFRNTIADMELNADKPYLVTTNTVTEEVIIPKEFFETIKGKDCQFIFDTYSEDFFFDGLEIQWIINGADVVGKLKDVNLATKTYLYNEKIEYPNGEDFRNIWMQDEILTPASGFGEHTNLEEENKEFISLLKDNNDYKTARMKYYIDYLNQYDMKTDNYHKLFNEEYSKNNSFRIEFQPNGELPGEFLVRTKSAKKESEFNKIQKVVDMYYIEDDGKETLEQSGIQLEGTGWYDLPISHNSTYELRNHEVEEGKIIITIPSNELPTDGKDYALAVTQGENEVKEIFENAIAKDPDLAKEIEKALAGGKNVDYVIEELFYTEEKALESSEGQVTTIKEIVGKDGIIAKYFDTNVYVNIVDRENNSMDGYSFYELDNKLMFKVAIPKELLKDGRTFSIVSAYDEGKIIPSTYKNGVLTFSVDELSMFAIAYKDAKDETITPPTVIDPPVGPDEITPPTEVNPPVGPGESGDETTITPDTLPAIPEVPETGDKVNTSDMSNTTLFTSLAVISLLGAAVLVLMKKRKELLNK